MAESTIKTVLILLENHHFITIDMDFYNHCIITPMNCELVSRKDGL